MHAGTGELVASAVIAAAKKTGMPDGVFSNLNSSGIEVGKMLVTHAAVKGVGFTGSIGGGRALFDLAAQREEPVPVFAEMGSINPVVLLPEAIKKRGAQWASTYAGSITLGSGQFCTKPGLLLGLAGEELDNFISLLSQEILKKAPNSMLHPNIIGAYEKNRATATTQEGTTVVAEYPEEVPVNFARQTVLTVNGNTFLKNTTLHQEVFGPFSLVVKAEDALELEEIIYRLEGQLTGTIVAETRELSAHTGLVDALQNRVGRLIYNGVPTGVEVCPAMHHGGPYPSSTDSRFTAVGIHAIKRWVRPVSYQDWPDSLLPDALKNENPLKISRLVNQSSTKEAIQSG
jgi:NADP-dependent aldehyde dehydrogenase